MEQQPPSVAPRPTPQAIDLPVANSRRRVLWLSALLPAAALVLMAGTWRLWMPQQVFPRIPLFAGGLHVPGRWQQLLLAGMLAALLASIGGAFRQRGERQSAESIHRRESWRRMGLVCWPVAALAMASVNQQRLQPWLVHLAIGSLLLALGRPSRSLALLRMFVVSIYFYSAVSKLDVSFGSPGGSGPALLEAFMNALGLSTRHWTASARFWVAQAFPAGELLIAIALCFRSTRAWGAAGSLAMHVALLLTLGPWGLNHSPGVLLWNLTFLVQNVLLFFPLARDASPTPAPLDEGWSPRLAGIVAAIALLAPSLEWFGAFDHWPAWSVYSSRPERVQVFVHASEVPRLPADLRPFAAPPAPLSDWSRLRIDRWSLSALRAPLPPQERFHLGVALAVAKQLTQPESIRVHLESPAARLSGRRTSRTLHGRDALAAEQQFFFLNLLPADNWPATPEARAQR